jgi:hypothetical protein
VDDLEWNALKVQLDQVLADVDARLARRGPDADRLRAEIETYFDERSEKSRTILAYS